MSNDQSAEGRSDDTISIFYANVQDTMQCTILRSIPHSRHYFDWFAFASCWNADASRPSANALQRKKSYDGDFSQLSCERKPVLTQVVLGKKLWMSHQNHFPVHVHTKLGASFFRMLPMTSFAKASHVTPRSAKHTQA